MRRQLGHEVEVDREPGRSASRTTRAGVVVSPDRGVVEVGVAPGEPLTASDCDRLPLEFFETDVNSGLEELLERTFNTLLLHEGSHVAELAAGRSKQLKIRAASIGENGALDQAEQGRIARPHTSTHDSLGCLERDRLAKECLQLEGESDKTAGERGVGLRLL